MISSVMLATFWSSTVLKIGSVGGFAVYSEPASATPKTVTVSPVTPAKNAGFHFYKRVMSQ